jgi:hypothetical protein
MIPYAFSQKRVWLSEILDVFRPSSDLVRWEPHHPLMSLSNHTQESGRNKTSLDYSHVTQLYKRIDRKQRKRKEGTLLF